MILSASADPVTTQVILAVVGALAQVLWTEARRYVAAARARRRARVVQAIRPDSRRRAA